MTPVVRRLLNFIGSKEAPRGYGDYYRGVSFAPPKPLTSMTLDQVMSWQRAANPPGPGTAAAGRYQFINKTLRFLKRKTTLTGSEKFDEDLQDDLALVLLERRGLSKWLDGKLSTTRFINKLAAEWASLPMASGPKKGRSRYDGDGVNSALCTVEEIRKVLKSGAQGRELMRSPLPQEKPSREETPKAPLGSDPEENIGDILHRVWDWLSTKLRAL